MKYILTITLALFISSNIHADEQKYIDEAKYGPKPAKTYTPNTSW